MPALLLTGATGFLGRHLLRALHESAVPAVVVARPASWSSQSWRDPSAAVQFIDGTPLTAESWREHPALATVRCIVHTAAMVQHSRTAPQEMIDFNVGATLQMTQLAARLRARLVFVSTSGTVGCYRAPDLNAGEDAPYVEDLVGRWPYYASKIRAEREARQLADTLGVELVIARPPVLLGPDDHRQRSTGYVRRVLEQRVPFVPPGSMHFADIRDVASALLRMATIERPRPVYHLPGWHGSLLEFFRLIADVSRVAPPTRPLPAFAAHALAKIGAILPRPHWLPDPVVLEMSTCHWGLSSHFAHELGYASRPAQQTVADTVAWLRNQDPKVESPHAR